MIIVSDVIKDLRAELAFEKQKNQDLTERLKKAMYWNKINQSKELQSLKINLAEAFQLDYYDFKKTQEYECSKDLFEVYRSTIKYMFGVIKSLGVILEDV